MAIATSNRLLPLLAGAVVLMLAFVGGGRTGKKISDLGSGRTRSAYGGGFRYLLAKKFGMRVGLDVAKGPEGTYVYLVVGNAW